VKYRNLQRIFLNKIKTNITKDVPANGLSLNKKYYVIWRNGRSAGFFSIITGIIGHIKIAEKLGMIPIIDLDNFPCIYQEKEKIFGTNNVFEYYFEPTSNKKLIDIYKSKQFFLSGGGYPPDHTMSISTNLELIDIWRTYFKLNIQSQEKLDVRRTNLLINERTLGVHFRGQEMRRFRSHPFPMKLRQAIALAQKELATGNFDKIFFVSEGENYLNKFEKSFPGLVVSSDSFRSRYINSYKIYPRKRHFYHLGVEILTDTILLSECGGIISASSNVSEMAIFLNQGKYGTNIQIRNGTNSSNIFLSKFLWYFKAMIPEKFGGFKEY
jgi:hypothetical protein